MIIYLAVNDSSGYVIQECKTRKQAEKVIREHARKDRFNTYEPDEYSVMAVDTKDEYKDEIDFWFEGREPYWWKK